MAGATGKMSGLSTGGLIDLAVVLACGFILCTWEPWRSHVRRQPSPAPYFTFLAVGVFWWMGVATVIPMLTRVCEWSSPICVPTFGQWMGASSERQHDFNALFSAIFFRVLLHWFMGKYWQPALDARGGKIKNWIRKQFDINLKGLEIEKMIAQALNGGANIMLTLSNRKVYVGAPGELSRDESGREKWISITPWKSGYRCEKTGKLTLTTNYDWMLELGPHGEVKYFSMCIPIREVVSCQFFDQDLFDRFRSEEIEAEMGDGKADFQGGERAEELKQGAAETRSARLVDSPGEREQGTDKQ